ncbi:MAG: hypothetical protein ACYC9N_00440 [Thermoanaerobaculia bacterium]
MSERHLNELDCQSWADQKKKALAAERRPISRSELAEIRKRLSPGPNPRPVIARFFEEYVAILEEEPIILGLLQQEARVSFAPRQPSFELSEPPHVEAPAVGEPWFAPIERIEDRLPDWIPHARLRNQCGLTSAENIGLSKVGEKRFFDPVGKLPSTAGWFFES